MIALEPHARRVADAVLAEEEAKRRHLVIALSGAHAYGFPSPDSDLDLKALHIAPTRTLLGLAEPRTTFDRAEIIEGVEIDYTSNELSAALRGLLKGNGNYLERVLGSQLLYASPVLPEVRYLARATLSKRYHAHYRGFATQQLRALDERAPTVKGVLYVLRTTLTGTHLLRTGELRVDLSDNLDDYDYADARTLIAHKRAGERTTLDADTAAHWRARVARAFTLLDEARERSPLPDEPAHADEVERWLVALRLRDLA